MTPLVETIEKEMSNPTQRELVLAEKRLVELLKDRKPGEPCNPEWWPLGFTPEVALTAIETGTPLGLALVQAHQKYLKNLTAGLRALRDGPQS